MFFEGERIWAVREFILANDKPAREKALAKLLPLQRGDFEGIFTAMDGLPVTIRLKHSRTAGRVAAVMFRGGRVKLTSGQTSPPPMTTP